MNEITQEQLRAMLTAADAEARAAEWTGPLNECMRSCAIDTPTRQAAFLGQVLLESSELRVLQENLSYSAERLCQVWPQRFPTLEVAGAYGHNPERLANRVYAGRLGNGDEASGDGWAYRGRGLIQLTGRANYEHFSRAMGLDALSHPELLQQPAGAALSAGWFWVSKGLNGLADRAVGAEAEDNFVEITRRVNGGINGLAQRRAYWQRALKALGRAAPV